jgi:uncharacterized protein (TIGR00266 family)
MITHEIIGDDMQAIVMSMGAGDVIRAEAGTLMYMTDGVDMDAKMEGGLLGGLKRKLLAGESLFITYFKGTSAGARVAFAGPYPGKIIHIALNGQPVLCQRDAFLCCTGDIDLSIAFTKRLGAGFFGGEGFILQKMEGRGDLFIHSGGTIVPFELKPGERPARGHRVPGGVGRRRRLRHHARRRHQDEPVRRRRVVFRVAHRTGPGVAADPAVLTARGTHPLRVRR